VRNFAAEETRATDVSNSLDLGFEGGSGSAGEISVLREFPEEFSHAAVVPATVVAGIISSLLTLRYLYLLRLPMDRLVCFVPDDAFYELQIARHFLSTGRWSFDGGFSSTTGFHLLNVYLMSLFPRVLANPEFAVRLWTGIGLALSIATVFIICRLAERLFGWFALLPVFLVLTSQYFIEGTTTLLEFPFVLVIAALYVRVLLGSASCPGKALAEIFLLGLAGSLARSDFGGMSLSVAVAFSARCLWDRRHDYLPRAVSGLAGASAGLGVVFLNNLFFGGHLLSGSVMAKALWGQREGFQFVSRLKFATFAFASSPREVRVIAAILTMGAVICAVAAVLRRFAGARRLRRIGGDELADVLTLAGAGLAAIVMYAVVYGFDAGVQSWYVVNFVIPMVLVLGAAAHFAQPEPVMRASCIAALLAACAFHFSDFGKPHWYEQRHMYEMSQYLDAHPVKGRVAGWNVGIIGYFLDGKVTNLDGLMNDQIYPYMRDAKIEKYLEAAQISYIVDFPAQLTREDESIPRGYAPSIIRRLKPLHTQPSLKRDVYWLDYTFYRFN
jgi:hypothetical protein